MGLFEALFIPLVRLLTLGLDIVGFFVVVRVVTLHWCIRPLLAFDQVGRPLVDPLVTAMKRVIPADWLGQEPRRTRLATAATLLTVAVCRFALNSAVQLVVLPL